MWELAWELAQRQMDSGESPSGVGSLSHPQPPSDVPGRLLHIQGVTGVSAQAGMCFLWILLPQGATLCHPLPPQMGTAHTG